MPILVQHRLINVKWNLIVLVPCFQHKKYKDTHRNPSNHFYSINNLSDAHLYDHYVPDTDVQKKDAKNANKCTAHYTRHKWEQNIY